MPDPHGGSAQASPRQARLVLVATFLFVLVASVISTGLLVYTVWRHDLEDGLFALAFAVLSARAVLSWRLWHQSLQLSDLSYHRGLEPRKSADETMR